MSASSDTDEADGDSVLLKLAKLLRERGDVLLNGSSTLVLNTCWLLQLNRMFQELLQVRPNQHTGFLALPTHPADNQTVIEMQLLFDMIQKTPSLKLIHLPGTRLHASLSIFSFISLEHLELRNVPLHCMEGLQAVNSNVKSLTCWKCVDTLEEVLSQCGGDFASGFSWHNLDTLNFSHNFIGSLDDSLISLPKLKILNLSHNKILDCEDFLKSLTELAELNLSFNLLERLPILCIAARSHLTTLMLGSNNLHGINGVEHLQCLETLDVSHNMLKEHCQLAPLYQLNHLHKLHLEGNCLAFHPKHRIKTVCFLSPQAAPTPLILDNKSLTKKELSFLPWMQPALGSARSSDQIGSQEAVSELEESLSMNKQPSDVKRMKKRKVAITDPFTSDISSDDHCLETSLSQALLYKAEIERMEDFRKQLGTDWLCYQHQMDKSMSSIFQVNPEQKCFSHVESTDDPKASAAVFEKERLEDEARPTNNTASLEGEAVELAVEARVTKTNEVKDVLEDHSTLQASTGSEQSELLKDEMEDSQKSTELDEELGECLSQPCLVRVLGEEAVGDGEQDKNSNSTLFLTIRSMGIVEQEPNRARLIAMYELSSLLEARAGKIYNTTADLDKVTPTLELKFRYLRRHWQQRTYAILDDDPQAALQALLCLLEPVATQNREAFQDKLVSWKCLKCGLEFKAAASLNESENLHSSQSDVTDVVADKRNLCPSCGSLQVVVVLSDDIQSSTPKSAHTANACALPSKRNCSSNQNEARSTTFNPNIYCTVYMDDVDSHSVTDYSLESVTQGSDDICSLPLETEAPRNNPAVYNATAIQVVHGETSTSDEYLTANEETLQPLLSSPGRENLSSFGVTQRPQSVEYDGKDAEQDWTSNLAGSYSYEHQGLVEACGTSLQDANLDSLMRGIDLDLKPKDFASVDHRLKLYLELNVFESNSERFRCFLLTSTVTTFKRKEFQSLLIFTSAMLYCLEITGKIRSKENPSTWLQLASTYRLVNLVSVELGRGHQSLQLLFYGTTGLESVTALIRDRLRCTSFLGLLTDLIKHVTQQNDSKFDNFTKASLKSSCKLMQVLQDADVLDPSKEENQQDCLYLLAFLLRDDMAEPVTVIATPECLCLLHEEHGWNQGACNLGDEHRGDESRAAEVELEEFVLKERQPISSLSGVERYRLAQSDIRLIFYNESTNEESFWHLQMETPKQCSELLGSLRPPWEELFSLELIPSLHELPTRQVSDS
uniref:serine/threonine-protein kinase 11-interacting protein-like isoform X2 n=1 Tax=Myxine glutinosa TaxID=7769 RepID=UPI00358EC17B